MPGKTSNPDPTRTQGLRRRVQADIARRFARIKACIVKQIGDEDALGLAPQSIGATTNAPGEWRFLPQDEQIRRFRDWLNVAVKRELFQDDDLWTRYIREGLTKGAARSYDDFFNPRRRDGESMRDYRRRIDFHKRYLKDNPDFYRGTRDEFLRDSFDRPVAEDKVKLLVGRNLAELSGVTDTMATQMTRILADGLIQGKSPREIARELVRRVDGIDKVRAKSIASTEIIRAHAEGQLLAMEKLGVEEVGVMVEWAVVRGPDGKPDKKVCPKCRAMDGVVLKIEEAKGMIPRHARCRCAWVAAQVGEDPTGQKKTKGKIEKAIAKSDAADGSDDWFATEIRIGKDRPKSLFGNEAQLIDRYDSLARDLGGDDDGGI